MFKTFKFNVGGYLAGYDEIQLVATEDEDQKYVLNIKSLYEDMPNMPKKVSKLLVELFDQKLDEIGVRNWDHNYINEAVLDGIQWDLEIDDMKWSGSNAFPKGFDDMISLLTDLFGFPEQSLYE
ncbi:MAG: hypothetical protein UFE77_11720, partial [Streptococcus salivarius]|nr:hypothetical protein [Streptococcus salivarius]